LVAAIRFGCVRRSRFSDKSGPAILPMECHRAFKCGHVSLANADAKYKPKIWFVGRPLSRSLRGLLFSMCLGFRTRGRLYSQRFWKRLRPNIGRLFRFVYAGSASFLTKCLSCVEVRWWRSCHVAFLVAPEKTNGCLVHVDFAPPLAS